MEMTVAYILDGALMVLLGVAIWFGIRLHRQIAAIREGRKELEGLIKDFTGATDRAESALADLKQEVGDTLAQARHSARQAAELCDDLEFLIKRGDKVADGLEKAVRGGQGLLPRDAIAEEPAKPAPRPASRPAARPAPQPSDPAESLLQEALQAARQEAPQDAPPPPPLAVDPEDRPGATARPQSRPAAAPAAGERGKSKTDLLKALRDMR